MPSRIAGAQFLIQTGKPERAIPVLEELSAQGDKATHARVEALLNEATARCKSP